ncbi:uncharacterized protein LOC127285020 [Leptopilina boulardi]|uniref:uncharacterized protein LOC127285020 n=1 Tax=Leptopilina boulardi TaxID=63433 RepID=UPI0021F672F2|nr:uncharacterized protein LOC127285020 [Leptopilina boulardi]
MWILQFYIMSIIFWQGLCHDVDILTCPHRMVAVLGLEPNTWVCDCIKPFVYYSETNSCHEVFFQGPCPTNYYLVFPSGELNAKCEENPCHEYAVVPFNGTCAHLYSRGPFCSNDYYELLVNDNYELYCGVPKEYTIITAPPKACEKGSRRTSLGLCKKSLQ